MPPMASTPKVPLVYSVGLNLAASETVNLYKLHFKELQVEVVCATLGTLFKQTTPDSRSIRKTANDILCCWGNTRWEIDFNFTEFYFKTN